MAGVESAVQIHISRGDDLNARDVNGMTPLMLSAARNKPTICKLLLDAGADNDLLAPSGKTAFEIAAASGAHEAAAALAPAQHPAPGPETVNVIAPTTRRNDFETTDERAPSQIRDSSGGLDGSAIFDVSGWEAEEPPVAPEADLSITRSAGAIQTAISAHEPIDSSTEWDDVDAYLPERASPLSRTDDAESRAQLRLLLLRAIREGSVPSQDVEDLSANDDRSADSEAESLLGMVINDLGAEVDERFEYETTAESYKVFVKSTETPDEELAIDEALATLDSAGSASNEPMRMYQREFQRQRLISAQEEVALGQAMEAALSAALDALAAWPEGIAWTLAAGSEVKTGRRPMGWMSHQEIEPDIELVAEPEVEAPLEEEVEDALDEAVDTAGGSESIGFASALSGLNALPISPDSQGTAYSAVRDALAALHLSRGFLMELGEIGDTKESEAGFRYAKAMADYRQARDRMTTANLRLVLHLAWKHRHSGEPIDDLTQEGNIGLLKAVDRYDWRRGFKFSTYATWWIRQSIGRYIADKRRTIRIPVHIHEKLQRLQSEVHAFESIHRRPPTLDEIAARMEIPACKVETLQRISPEPLPIHELPVDELVAIEDRGAFSAPDPAEIVMDAERSQGVIRALSTLAAKEENILRLRFGIGTQESLTLEEIGLRYSVTRERIRQIEAKAIKKLRHPSRAPFLARLCPPGIPCEATTTAATPDRSHDAETQMPGDVGQPDKPGKNRVPSQAGSGLNSSSPVKSSMLDQLLAQAATLGVPVVDDRAGPSGQIWVKFLYTPDKQHRRLARKLTDSGFTFFPGKGYWK